MMGLIGRTFVPETICTAVGKNARYALLAVVNH
jgi:membrane protein YqaA with SNARE-associated domain